MEFSPDEAAPNADAHPWADDEGDESPATIEEELDALRSSRHVARRTRRIRKAPVIWTIVIVGLAALIYFFGWPWAETRIAEWQAEAALGNVGLDQISVRVDDHTAVLSGEVSNEDLIERAIEETQRIPGVDTAISELLVTAASNSQSENAIRDALSAAGLGYISVTVDGEHVTLEGTVPDADALELASTTVLPMDGISEVDNLLEIAIPDHPADS